LKAVICDSTKEEDLREALNLIKEFNRSTILVLQPNSRDQFLQIKYKLDNFKEICTEEGITACIIPQMHKIIGVK